ncbi:MAG: hypothetical protein V9G24_15815 [Rhodoblastus sp.]
MIEIDRRSGSELEHDHARHRNLVEVDALTEPRLEQQFGFALGHGADIGDAGKGAYGLDDAGDVGVDIAIGRGFELNRRLARHARTPFLARLTDQDGAAGGERGQKAHDGDDDDQRAAGNARCGHQRGLAVARPSIRPLRRRAGQFR